MCYSLTCIYCGAAVLVSMDRLVFRGIPSECYDGVCSDMRHRPLLPVLLLCYKSDVDAESILIIFKVSPNGSSDILKENQRETLNQ